MQAATKKWIALAALAAAAPLLALQVKHLVSEAAPPTTRGADPPPLAAPDLDAAAPRPGTYSNIYRYDYVGPDTCGKCHTQNYESWRQHPHSKMNRPATASTVVGEFSGVRLEYADESVVFAKGGGELTMTLYKDAKFVRQFRITKTVGSRYVQTYIGVQSRGPEAADDPVYTNEVKLPFSYWIRRHEWYPETYDDAADGGGEYDKQGRLTAAYATTTPRLGRWEIICTKCHNTYPYASRVEAASTLVGFPPADLTLAKVTQDTRAPNARLLLPQSELITLGISCESCHFGGREHALQGASISFLPRSQDLTFPKATDKLIANARQSNYVVNSICRQCHTAQLPSTYPNGSASWNSREAVDMSAGACASEIRCTNCHNPHVAGPTTPDGPDNPKHVAACASCHEKYEAPAAAAAHSKHDASVTCLDCHMPRMVHGLAGMLRSHRISSPTDERMLRGEWPNACNACHLDKSVRWTASALASKWGKTIAIDAAWKAPDDPVGKRWLASEQSIVRSFAVDMYSRSPLGAAMLPELFAVLEDPAPPNRMFGVLSLERILGRPIDADEYTPWASPAVRKQQAAALAARAMAR